MIDTIQIAENAFERIFDAFPRLTKVDNPDHPVEISLTLPVQEGLKHKVWLCLQNIDELHFSAGWFHFGWFPCTEPEQVEAYIDAVTGFLSGRYRILEHYKREECVKAELQKPVEGGWETLRTWSTVGWPFPKERTFSEVRNV